MYNRKANGIDYIKKVDVINTYNLYEKEKISLDNLLEQVTNYFKINNLTGIVAKTNNKVSIIDIINPFRFNFWNVFYNFHEIFNFEDIYKLAVRKTLLEVLNA